MASVEFDDSERVPGVGEPFPIGYALSILRGAILNLNNALENGNPSNIMFHRTRLVWAMAHYKISAEVEGKKYGNLLIVRKYLRVGEEDLSTAEAMLQATSSLLSAGLRLL